MVARSIDATQRRAARIAGAAYLLIIGISLLSLAVGPFKLLVSGDAEATVQNLLEHESLFRTGLAWDLAMYAGVVVLAVALYAVLEPVGHHVALLALLWRTGEAVLGCLSVFGGMLVLLLARGEGHLAAFETVELHALAVLFLDARSASAGIVFLFLGLGSIAYFWLFYRSRYIPRALAVAGIVAYSLALLYPFADLFLPGGSWLVLGVPAILFEILVGLWLLFQGIRLPAPAPA